jgi:hypothetical protein
MEILVWLILLPIVVVVRSIIVGAPTLAKLGAEAEFAITNAENVYKSRLQELSNVRPNP